MIYAQVKSVGHYVPKQEVTNDMLAQYMDTSDQWIRERTGIQKRRFFDPTSDTTANMAAKAAKMALERANLQAEDIDFIIFSTLSPDYFFPGSGVLLQKELGVSDIGALDIRNACSGFIYGLSIAHQYIQTGMYKRILLVASEIQSGMMELTDEGRSVAVIFGDGAGAAIIEASDDGPGILSTHLHADGNYAEELFMKNPKRQRTSPFGDTATHDEICRPHMNGNAVFKHAVKRFQEVILEALEKNNKTPEDIDLLVPHQANLRINQYVQQQLGLADEKIYNNIMRYGNTTSASIPIALSEAWQEGKIKSGDLLCLAAFGSGFAWGSTLLYW